MQTRMSTHGFTWRAQILLLLLAVAPVDAEIVGSRVVRFPWTSFVQRVDGAVYVTALRFDSAGNVVVAATLDDVISSELMVASFAREDGTLRWVYRLPEHPGTENFVYDAAVDKRGDVVLSGFTDGVEEVPEVGTRFAAIKLDGETGSVRWRSDLGLGGGRSLAIDARGDVFVTGGSYRQEEDGNVVGSTLLRKLDALDGRTIWESGDLGPGFWFPLALDARGDAFVDGPAAIIKYGGADGREMWRSPAGESVMQVQTFGGGGVVAHECHVNPERHTYETHVVRRRKRDGIERWRRVYPEGRMFGCLLKVATWRHRSVFIGGTDPSGVWIARLDGKGLERWRTYFHPQRDAGVESIALSTSAEVVVHWTKGVIAFSARTGTEMWRFNEATWRQHRVAVDRDGTVAFARDAHVAGCGSGLLISTISEGATGSLPPCD